MKEKETITFIGAGMIGTALGNILAETGTGNILLHSIEKDVVKSITETRINSRYFPTLQLHPALQATTDNRRLHNSGVIFLAVPSAVLLDYLKSIRQHIPPGAILVNLAKGFGSEHKTITECLKEGFPNPVCTLKGPSFAREIINRLPTGFTLGYEAPVVEPGKGQGLKNRALTKNGALSPVPGKITALFNGTNIHLDYTDDILGVEILSILKNIFAVALGIIDAHFNSANLRFLVLTKAFREMRRVLVYFGGSEDTLFNYCGYGDFTLTALNDLSRNRTLGLLIGKGFFTEHVSHELVLEGRTALNIFYEEISKKMNVNKQFPIIAELYKIFDQKYDSISFVKNILNIEEP
ncbi:MAG: NAD(P)H-dependent glycerol-3-phosphate dehydrogenase [bacterium]